MEGPPDIRNPRTEFMLFQPRGFIKSYKRKLSDAFMLEFEFYGYAARGVINY